MSFCTCDPLSTPTLPSLASTCHTYALFMGIIDNYIRLTCPVSKLCDRVSPVLSTDNSYDFIVVGSGSGGSVVASRLSEVSDWKVLLLEAGGDEPAASQVPQFEMNFLGHSDLDWGYRTEPQPEACLGYLEGRCTWPRAKVFGGNTVINGMKYMRGVPRDYDSWAEAGNSGWSYEEVLPYFRKSEDNLQFGGKYHGKGGYMTTTVFNHQPDMVADILEGAREVGLSTVDDLTVEPYVGMAVAQTNSRNGTRLSTAKAFIWDAPVKDRLNLHVMLNALVTKLLIQDVGGVTTCVGLTYIHNGYTYSVKASKEVILAAGSLNTPQLLMLSGVGPSEALQNSGVKEIEVLPGVGQNLWNHVNFQLDFVLKNLPRENDLNWENLMTYLDARNGTLSSTGIQQLSARWFSKFAEGERPDLQLFFLENVGTCTDTFAVNVSTPGDPHRKISIVPCLLQTKSRGNLTLNSNNPLAPPVMHGNYLRAKQDVEGMLEGIRFAQKLGKTVSLREKYGMEQVVGNYGDCNTKHELDSDDFWRCAMRYKTGPENHQAGTCKMGPDSDDMAVMDPRLKVRNVAGLRVADASVIPAPISGNIHATIVMIAERCADFIKDDWLGDQTAWFYRNCNQSMRRCVSIIRH